MPVTSLSATVSNGQVWLRWNNVSGINKQYNLYRGTTPFATVADITPAKFMGFVRDNSSKNIRLSTLLNVATYFSITNLGTPLLPTEGLYVVTCTNTGTAFYYCITVTDLATNIEELVITSGNVTVPITDIVSQPKPVHQFDLLCTNGEIRSQMVWFGNNQETALLPALNSTGSYGFNWFYTKRGSLQSGNTLFVIYEHSNEKIKKGPGFDTQQTDCYIMGSDDWLPNNQTTWGLWHEKYNIYSTSGVIPTTGKVKTFFYRRVKASIDYMVSTFAINSKKIYSFGVSQKGYMAIETGMLYPDVIAATYAIVPPPFTKPTGGSANIRKAMWGKTTSNLLTGHLDWQGNDIPAYTVLDIRLMVVLNKENPDHPILSTWHGKNDVKVLWSTHIIQWFDAVNDNHIGHLFVWDQRTHTVGAEFLQNEPKPIYTRYATDKSYPAFSNCSVNDDPGNGVKTNGDPRGQFNGYLEWNDTITDTLPLYSVDVFVKDFFIGSVQQTNQTTCTASITFRRLQTFIHAAGTTIHWDNRKVSDNSVLQSGTFVMPSNILITLDGIIINEEGNHINLFLPPDIEPPISGCTNPLAVNFDPLATVDDGSCVLPPPPPVTGCTDPTADNFDPLATVDDGSCVITVIYGCNDPSALNYDPAAQQDDGSCIYEVVVDPPEDEIIRGCTDPEALNYNPLAEEDNGTCLYPPEVLNISICDDDTFVIASGVSPETDVVIVIHNMTTNVYYTQNATSSVTGDVTIDFTLFSDRGIFNGQNCYEMWLASVGENYHEMITNTYRKLEFED